MSGVRVRVEMHRIVDGQPCEPFAGRTGVIIEPGAWSTKEREAAQDGRVQDGRVLVGFDGPELPEPMWCSMSDLALIDQPRSKATPYKAWILEPDGEPGRLVLRTGKLPSEPDYGSYDTTAAAERPEDIARLVWCRAGYSCAVLIKNFTTGLWYTAKGGALTEDEQGRERP